MLTEYITTKRAYIEKVQPQAMFGTTLLPPYSNASDQVQLIAVQPYSSGRPSHLSFPTQAVITAKQGQEGNSFWFGKYNGEEGWFHIDCCRLLQLDEYVYPPLTQHQKSRRSLSYDQVCSYMFEDELDSSPPFVRASSLDETKQCHQVNSKQTAGHQRLASLGHISGSNDTKAENNERPILSNNQRTLELLQPEEPSQSYCIEDGASRTKRKPSRRWFNVSMFLNQKCECEASPKKDKNHVKSTLTHRIKLSSISPHERFTSLICRKLRKHDIAAIAEEEDASSLMGSTVLVENIPSPSQPPPVDIIYVVNPIQESPDLRTTSSCSSFGSQRDNIPRMSVQDPIPNLSCFDNPEDDPIEVWAEAYHSRLRLHSQTDD